MKKITIQFIAITLTIVAFTITDTFAQKRIKFKDGKAKVSSNVEAKGKVTHSVSGKDFRVLKITVENGGKFKYEIRRGSELLSSGHQTGFKIESDGKSVYQITFINTENKAKRPIFSYNQSETLASS